MGRPSKLTDKQWGEIGRRLANGEPTNALAREYKVSKATVSERFSNRVDQIKTLADQIVTTDRTAAALAKKLEELPVSEQCSVMNLVDQLNGIQKDYARSAASGTRASATLNAMVERKVEEIRDKPLTLAELGEGIMVVDGLTKIANRAAGLASNLIAANKPEKQGLAGGLESIIDGSWGEK